jgi:hypothetical protein
LDVVVIFPCSGIYLLKRARKAIQKLGVRWYSGSRSVVYLHPREIKLSVLKMEGGEIEIDGILHPTKGGEDITLKCAKSCIVMYGKKERDS